MSEVTPIDSSDLIDDIETSFRVQAGPGAGKTYWLVRHIRQVLQRSKRLKAGQRVACISYTNVAVEELQDDLFEVGVRGDEVEVSTIHSFLYRNVVRPYLHLLKNADGECLVNHAEVDGPTEIRPGYGSTKRWLRSAGRSLGLMQYEKEWRPYLERVSWKYDGAEWSLDAGVDWSPDYLPTTDLNLYKVGFWEKGVIHHSDVLYFAHRILSEFSQIRSFLSARFSYVFIDEFQDTGYTQAELTRWLAQEGTVVGVIGDVEQSVYRFRGARPEELEEFEVSGLTDYSINLNRRSTQRIVEFLNSVRSDGLEQGPSTDAELGETIRCLVGPSSEVVKAVQEERDSDDLAILAYKNDVVANFRRAAAGATQAQSKVWKEFKKMDSDYRRVQFVWHALCGARLAKEGRMGLAVRKIAQGVRVRKSEIQQPFECDRPISSLERRAIAVTIGQLLSTNISKWVDRSLKDVQNDLKRCVSDSFDGIKLKGYSSRGDSGNFASATSFGDLIDSVSLSLAGEKDQIRTIHKSKGAEFDDVLVWLHEEKTLKLLVSNRKNESEAQKEERRVYYVGASRAKKQLMFGVPALSGDLERKLGELEVDVQRLD